MLSLTTWGGGERGILLLAWGIAVAAVIALGVAAVRWRRFRGAVEGLVRVMTRSSEPAQLSNLNLTQLQSRAPVVLDLVKVFNRMVNALVDEQERTEESYRQAIESLVVALDARDNETWGHSQRVVEYTRRIARQMGIEGEAMRDITWGALLHDIGKMGVSDAILRKPASLTGEEWAEMRQHSMIGYRILSRVEFLREAALIPWAHHESWDGKGYPRGLRGEQIPRGARIFMVADAFEAMTADRVYRQGISFDRAKAEILAKSGTQFDPQVAEAFVSISDAEWLEIQERAMRATGMEPHRAPAETTGAESASQTQPGHVHENGR